MDRGELDALVDERIRYTVQFAAENSPFYRKWFRTNKIDPSTITEHEDLRDLPIISGKNVRERQPPGEGGCEIQSIGRAEGDPHHGNRGPSGNPKSFFLTWEDWNRY